VRKYFQGRLLVTHALALLLTTVCLLLSHWQWTRAHYVRQASASSKPVAFEQLSQARDFLPPSSVGATTKLIGTWQPNSRILLAKRPADGRKLLEGTQTSAIPSLGTWVVNLLVLRDGTSVAVVRGWTSSDRGLIPATGPANISGIVQPAEDAPNEIAITAKPLLTTKFLLSHSRTDVRDGFVVETGVNGSLTQVVPTRQSFTSNGLRTLNVFYTFNWIFFAGLILIIWIRVVRDEVSSAH